MRKIHAFIIPLFAIVVLDWMISLASCKKTGQDQPAPDPCKPKYTTDIKPVINAKCAVPGCHDANSTVAKFTIDSIVKNRADIGRIRGHVFELKIMPPQAAPQLTEEEKFKLKCWLDNGAPMG
jgi:uncharacterized membrane protein